MTDEIFPLVQILSASFFLLPLLILTLLTHGHLFSSHEHYEHTHSHIYRHTHTLTRTHMADPGEVMVDLWLFGLLCYFNVAHEGTLKPTPDSMTEGPNYHSHGGERGAMCVCVCVS